MKIRNISRLLAIALAIVMVATLFVGCKSDFDAETTPFVMAVQDLDGVFNGYYSTSGPDGQIVGLTQISMFDTDRQGAAVWGGDRPCLTLAFKNDVVYGNTTNTVTEDTYTDYTYVLKPNVKFSDGSSVSIKDVLFGYYVVLDPVYTGSSTMYSTEILGLNQYRTQTYEDETSGFDNQFTVEAYSRAQNVAQAVFALRFNTIDNIPNYFKSYTPQDRISFTEDANGIRTYTITSKVLDELKKDTSDTGKQIVKDYEYISRTFYEELETDYNSALSNNYEPNDKGVLPYPNITCAQQYFMYINGYVDTDKKTGDALADDDPDAMINKAKNMTREDCLNLVYENKMPGAFPSGDEIYGFSFYQIVNYWVTGSTVQTRWAAEAKELSLSERGEVDHIYGITWNEQFKVTDKVDSVSGELPIRPACYDSTKDAVVIDNVEYPLAEYDANGNYVSGFEVLNVRIKKVDPKAIWSFAVSVTPMKYYSNDNVVSGWNGGAKDGIEANFGVVYSSLNFYTNNVQAKKVPVGAGVYKAESLTYTSFFTNNQVFYERNTYFYTLFCDNKGVLTHTQDDPDNNNAKIKYVRYRVSNTNQVMDALSTGDIDYADPSATATNINTVQSSKNLKHLTVDNLGYGYIGINAGKPGLQNVHVRRAIMKAMDTTLVLTYYTNGLASNIWYPMSSVSWAYPKSASGSEFIYKYDSSATHEDIKSELDLAISTSANTSGVSYAWGGTADEPIFLYNEAQLELTFTIAGSTDDHPAWMTMAQAADILNELGVKVTVKNDSNTLKKLASGGLQVWAAAWSSGIDPDLYQVYHMESNASSTYNWGYREIKKNSNVYAYEQEVMEELSELIDEARSTLVKNDRIALYKDCLDLILDLAVELPTYQRCNMFAYNIKKLDESTMVTNCTAYEGPLAYLWKLNYND